MKYFVKAYYTETTFNRYGGLVTADSREQAIQKVLGGEESIHFERTLDTTQIQPAAIDEWEATEDSFD